MIQIRIYEDRLWGKYRSQDQYFNFIDTEMFTDAGKSKNILITGIQTLTLKQLDVLWSRPFIPTMA